jgi:hypothetical protein
MHPKGRIMAEYLPTDQAPELAPGLRAMIELSGRLLGRNLVALVVPVSAVSVALQVTADRK